MVDIELAVAAPAPVDPAEVFGVLARLSPEEFARELQMLPPDMQEAAQEVRDELRALRNAQLSGLIKRIEAEKLNPTIRAKAPIDARMAEDERQYFGFDRTPAAKADRQGVPSDAKEVDAIPPALNLTAPRTNTWVARIVNMSFSGGQLSGTIRPTPMPAGDSSGQAPFSNPEQDQAFAKDMELRASRMDRVIKDQFAECKLPREGRKSSFHLGMLGTGILAGPFRTRPKRTRFRSLGGGVYEPTAANEIKPIYRSVHPRKFYPEMVECIEDASFTFELMLVSKRELAEWSTQPGFNKFRDQFAELLDKEYTAYPRGEIAGALAAWNERSPNKETTENRLAVWRFFGYLDEKDMEVCGCEVMKDSDGIVMPTLVEMYFCDGRPLYAEPVQVEGSMRVPYYVTKLFPIDDTMFGGGIPYAARDAQASINALWRAAQHNAVVSAGPQIGYRKGLARPVDGDLRVRGPKVWEIDDSTDAKSIQDVLSSMLIDNNADQYLALLKMRMEFFDEEINLPLIAQGQPDAATPTSTGLTMQMRAAAVAILNVGQNCEDGWITPLLEAAYHYNMIYHPDPAIKGDFDPVSKLVSDSVTREIKAQGLLVLNNLKATDPELAIRVRQDVFYQRLATALEQDADLFLDEDEVKTAREQMPQPPPDPRVIQAQIDQQRLEAEIAFREQDRQLDNQEKMRELDIREYEAQSRIAVAQMQREIKFAELALKEQLTLAQLEAKLGLEREKTGAKVRVEAEKLAQRDAENQLEVTVEGNPGARLA